MCVRATAITDHSSKVSNPLCLNTCTHRPTHFSCGTCFLLVPVAATVFFLLVFDKLFDLHFYLHHFMRSHFGFIAQYAFGWCYVDSAIVYITSEFGLPHNNLFVRNEFIVCIISQSLCYKQHFKMAFNGARIIFF